MEEKEKEGAGKKAQPFISFFPDIRGWVGGILGIMEAKKPDRQAGCLVC